MGSEVSANLDRFISSGLNDALFEAMTKSAAIVRNSAVQKAPRKTGNLKRSIDFKVEDDGSSAVVFSNCSYAPYVCVGTGIHSSQGTGRKTKWVYPYYLTHQGAEKLGYGVGGAVNFATTEGQKPQPFLKPALEENQNAILKQFEGII